MVFTHGRSALERRDIRYRVDRGARATENAVQHYVQSPSGICMASFDRKQPRWPPLKKENHQDENADLAVHGAEARLEQLIEAPDTQ